MTSDNGVDKEQQHYVIKKMINLAIRATCFNFLRRNEIGNSPDFTVIAFSCCFGLSICLFVVVFVFVSR